MGRIGSSRFWVCGFNTENEISHTFSHCCTGQLRHFCAKVLSFGKRIINGHYRSWILDSFHGVIAIGSFLSFLLAIGCAYWVLFPRAQPVATNNDVSELHDSIRECILFKGRWVQDESYPLYNASHCPFAEQGFNCLANGRRDMLYTKWRWKPKNCNVPRFNVRETLKLLHGKRIVFVGDSLGRSQWESLICMLMTGVEDKRMVHEVNGNEISKHTRFLGVWFSSVDLRVDFYRSVFLVQPGPVPKRAPKRVKSTLKLDELDDISNEWIDSDVLIFNSGHWWTPSKLFELGCYFQMGGSLKLGMPITTAFSTALGTWASWVENTVNSNKTTVFFRTFEASHWSGRNHLSCKVTRLPSLKTGGRDRNPFSRTIIKVTKQMSTPVRILHVTPMVAFRSDAHVGSWSDNPSVSDCSHWCLPGVPDMWNEILLAYLSSAAVTAHP